METMASLEQDNDKDVILLKEAESLRGKNQNRTKQTNKKPATKPVETYFTSV